MDKKKIIVDACIGRNVVYYLKYRGYDVAYINDINPRMDDEKVKKMARVMDAIIITSDIGFEDYDLALHVENRTPPYRIYRMLEGFK